MGCPRNLDYYSLTQNQLVDEVNEMDEVNAVDEVDEVNAVDEANAADDMDVENFHHQHVLFNSLNVYLMKFFYRFTSE
jgi:hypothetical protein